MAASSSQPAVVPERARTVTPREAGLAIAITLVGIALRWVGISQCELSHFDEGVYASNVWFGPESGYAYPARHLYAPPLVPALIELSIAVLGPGGVAPLLPGLVCGCLLIPLVWWVGRQWFGTPAGLVAATLAALSGPHAYFSRTALTDTPLCLFLTAAVYLGGEWLQRGRGWRLLGAGVCAGLAWWTKYNGWLSLAIVAAAVPPWLLFRRWQTGTGSSREDVPRETPHHSADQADGAMRGRSRGPRDFAGGVSPDNLADRPQPAGQEIPSGSSLPVELARQGNVSRETGAADGVSGGVSRETGEATPLGRPGVRPVPRETDLDLVRDAARAVPRETAVPEVAAGDVPRETAVGVRDLTLVPGSVSRETDREERAMAGETPTTAAVIRDATEVVPLAPGASSVSRGTAPTARRRGTGPATNETDSHPGVAAVLLRLTLYLALAGLVWLPVVWGLESAGGYQVVSANHRRYLVGWSGMLDSLVRQFQSLSFLEDLHQRLAWVIGLAIVWKWRDCPPAGLRWWQLLGAAAILCGTLPVTTLAALMFLVSVFVGPLRSSLASSRWGELPVWLLAAWWVSLALATPGYTPYPRLTLPWLVASWLAAGAWAGGWLVDRLPTAQGKSGADNPTPDNQGNIASGASLPTVWVLAFVGVMLLAVGLGNRPTRREFLTLHPQQGLARVAGEVAEALRQDLGQPDQGPINALVYVHAEPALLYHLRVLGLPVVQPVQDLAFTQKSGVDRAPTFVIVGDRSRREPGFEGPPLADSRWRQVTELEFAVPPLVWLDEAWEPIDGSTDRSRTLDRPYHLEVWRVGSAPNPD
ncbi:MAG: ArnT family glycosyltransferase [Planctomycetaceae bacterium]